MPEGILLDSKIRDYVLIPIFLVVVTSSWLRQNIMGMFKNEPKVDLKEVKTNNMLARCRVLKAGHQFISEKRYLPRKAYFVKKDQGVLVKNVPKPKDPMEMFQGGGSGADPMAAMGMMKNQMVFMVLQGLTGYWVSHLFSGFVVARTPFPLGFQFKGMLQRGVEVQSLDSNYVSALCWYMFIMICSHTLSGLFQSLFSKGDTENGDDPMMAMMGAMGGGGMGMMPGGGPDMSKVYKQEQESLEMISHEFLLSNIEGELFTKWRAERRS